MQNLLQYLGNIAQYSITQVWLVLKPNQPLSWKTLLSLCLFSWLMAFMTSDAQWMNGLAGNSEDVGTSASFLWFQMSFVRWLLFTFGWIFLCLSMAWMLSASRVTLPLLGLTIDPAAWVVGLLSVIYVFLLGTGDVRMGAIVAWPALSAGYTLLPKLFTSKGKFQRPSPALRQHFVMVLFASATVSCWLQFCVVVQGWLAEYPPLTLAPLEQSALITSIGSNSTATEVAKETLDQTVQLLPEAQVLTWVRNVGNASEAVNARFQTKLQAQIAAQSALSGDRTAQEEETNARGEAADATVPTVSEPMREIWRLMLVRDGEDSRAVRLQLRSLLPTPSTASDAYIEYLCRIQKYTPPTGVPATSSPDPSIPPPVSPRPISQPVPLPEGNFGEGGLGGNENSRNNSNDNVNNVDDAESSDLSAPNPSTPDSSSVDENPENYRQSTIDCEFVGLYIP